MMVERELRILYPCQHEEETVTQWPVLSICNVKAHASDTLPPMKLYILQEDSIAPFSVSRQESFSFRSSQDFTM